jgi:DNA topoisomerase IA
LPGAKSAGRVQSVTLRIICEREIEIEAFRPREFWTVKALLTTPSGQEFEARLTELGGKKLEKFVLGDATSAEIAAFSRHINGLILALQKFHLLRHICTARMNITRVTTIAKSSHAIRKKSLFSAVAQTVLGKE